MKPRQINRTLRAILLALMLAMSAAAHAVTYYADAARPDDSGDGRSWGAAKKTLQVAIDTTTTAHDVWVKKGIYNENRGGTGALVLRGGVALHGGFAGGENDLSQRNVSLNETVIDGSTARGGAAAYHVVIMDTITNARLDGFTIRGGVANGPRTGDVSGGGIHCSGLNGSSPIANCTISGNTASWEGGGVYCSGGCWPTLTSCTVSGNTAGFGGGVYFDVGLLTLTNCTISGNTATYDGGGAYCWYTSGVATNCTISGNTAIFYGGGVYCLYELPALTNCTIGGNTGQVGGAVFCAMAASPVITNCTISGNAAYYAGGLFCTDNADPRIRNTIFENNTGRAVFEMDTDSDPLVESCLWRNNPDGDYYDEGSLSLTGAAAINNLVNYTGARDKGNRDGDPKFVMDGPGATTGTWTAAPTYDGTTSRTTLTDGAASFTTMALVGRLINADVTQRRQALITSNTATRILAVGNITGYAHNGDRYKLVDYHLLSGSAAIDAGTSVGAPSFDKDGLPRPVDMPGQGADGTPTEYDIGAYEFQGSLPNAPSRPGVKNVGLDRLTWTWRDNSSDETRFWMFSGRGAVAPTSRTAVLVANTTQWTTTGLAANTAYAFRVRAASAGGTSSKTPNYTTWTLIQAVSGLVFYDVTGNSMWVASANTPSNLTAGASGLYLANSTVGTNSGWQQNRGVWASSNLTPNTRYVFRGKSRNGGGVETVASTASKYTLAAAPAIGNNVTCNRATSTSYPAGTAFTFSNPAGFGAGTHGGNAYRVSVFRYVWDTNATYSFSGGEAQWSAGNLVWSPAASGSYYLHLQSRNEEGVATAATGNYGPFRMGAKKAGARAWHLYR